VRQGLHFLRAELPGILATRTDALSPRMLRILEPWNCRHVERGAVVLLWNESNTRVTRNDTPVRSTRIDYSRKDLRYEFIC
jgi:hypothetical protein